MVKNVVCILILVLCGFQVAYAQLEEAANSEAMLIAYKQQQLITYEADAISFLYRPGDYEATPLTAAEILEVNNLAQTTSYSVDDLKKFVNKKNQYLKLITKAMGFFKIPMKNQNLVTESLNDQIYKNKNILISSNTKVFSIQLGFALGAGAQEGFLNKLRKNKLLSFLPAEMNYFFASSLGFSIVRTVVNNKVHYSIEGVYETKKGVKTVSPFIIAKAGFALSYAIENRQIPELYETTQLLKISALNLETNNNIIRFSVLAGPSLAPAGALVAGIEGVTQRVNVSYTGLKQILTSKYKSLFKIKTQCAELVRGI